MNLTKCDAVDMWQKIFAQIQRNQTKIACKFLTLITKKQFHIETQKQCWSRKTKIVFSGKHTPIIIFEV